MKIVLVDDHKIVADGLSQLLDSSHEIVGTFSDPQHALKFLATQEADLLITDYEMKGLNGIDLYQAAKELQPLLKGVLLSMHDETSIVKKSVKAGMHGFLLKNIDRIELKIALDKISKGHTYISAELTQKLIHQETPVLFSDREMEVLRLIVKEYTNKKIAYELHLSERTVETYRKNLFQKANTNNIVGLIKFAYENKLIK